tara:strand:+ start:854 stop:1090 length:237 start_codon:yes stop_codon:yes gene_type:complete
MALQSSGAISFADINTEIGNTSTATLHLQGAGQSFGLDDDATNWSDSVVGLSMNEFYGLDIDSNYGSGGAGGDDSGGY